MPPSVINNRTMIPLRALFEALGKEVLWIDASKIIVVANSMPANSEDTDKLKGICNDMYSETEIKEMKQ